MVDPMEDAPLANNARRANTPMKPNNHVARLATRVNSIPPRVGRPRRCAACVRGVRFLNPPVRRRVICVLLATSRPPAVLRRTMLRVERVRLDNIPPGTEAPRARSAKLANTPISNTKVPVCFVRRVKKQIVGTTPAARHVSIAPKARLKTTPNVWTAPRDGTKFKSNSPVAKNAPLVVWHRRRNNPPAASFATAGCIRIWPPKLVVFHVFGGRLRNGTTNHIPPAKSARPVMLITHPLRTCVLHAPAVRTKTQEAKRFAKTVRSGNIPNRLHKLPVDAAAKEHPRRTTMPNCRIRTKKVNCFARCVQTLKWRRPRRPGATRVNRRKA